MKKEKDQTIYRHHITARQRIAMRYAVTYQEYRDGQPRAEKLVAVFDDRDMAIDYSTYLSEGNTIQSAVVYVRLLSNITDERRMTI